MVAVEEGRFRSQIDPSLRLGFRLSSGQSPARGGAFSLSGFWRAVPERQAFDVVRARPEQSAHRRALLVDIVPRRPRRGLSSIDKGRPFLARFA